MYDKENLTKIKKMNDLAPEVMKTFWAFDKAAVAEGVIPVKYKELIAIAVALTTQCPYCIDIHSGNARKAGATDREITEAAMVAAGPSSRSGGHTCDTCSAQLTKLQSVQPEGTMRRPKHNCHSGEPQRVVRFSFGREASLAGA